MDEKEVMLGVPEDILDEIELTNAHAVIDIPENSIEVEIRCKVYHDGEIMYVSRMMSMNDVREAINKGEDFIDDNDVFTLTEKGQAYLDHSGGEDTRPF